MFTRYAESIEYRTKNKEQTTKMKEPVVAINNLEKLIVYQKARSLSKDVLKYFYSVLSDIRSDFLVLQLLRSVTSVGANIAEGYGRHYKRNYRQFLSIARGSCYESDYWLEVAISLNKYNNKILKDFKLRNFELIKMLTVMMKNLERRVQET